jgi:bacteriorhodopsin
MATGEGIAYKHSIIHYPHKHVPDTHQEYLRQVFWVRYLNWIITTPLILINMALLGGLSGANLVVAIAADLIMFTAGLTATFAHDERRWVWYTIVIISFLTIGFQVGVNGARSVRRGADQHRALFTSFVGANLLVFLLYPMYVPFSISFAISQAS